MTTRLLIGRDGGGNLTYGTQLSDQNWQIEGLIDQIKIIIIPADVTNVFMYPGLGVQCFYSFRPTYGAFIPPSTPTSTPTNLPQGIVAQNILRVIPLRKYSELQLLFKTDGFMVITFFSS